jgi:hypothetical protein
MHDVELSDGEQNKSFKKIVKSDAWPKEEAKNNEAKSEIH